MKIYYAEVREAFKNTNYPYCAEIESKSDLAKVIVWDVLPDKRTLDPQAESEGSTRQSGSVFVESDCNVIDLDNGTDGGPELPSEQWINSNMVSEKLPGVKFFASTSRNYEKNKFEDDGVTLKVNGSARCREHLFFPTAHSYTSKEQLKKMRDAVIALFPAQLDDSSNQDSHFFAGTSEAMVKEFSGELCLDQYLELHPEMFPKEKEKKKVQTPCRDYDYSDNSMLMAALEYLDPSLLSDDDWIHVLMGASFEGIPTDVLEAWSSRDSNSRRYHPGETEKRVENFKGSGYTGGTVVYLAEQQGFDKAGWMAEHFHQTQYKEDGCLAWDDEIEADWMPPEKNREAPLKEKAPAPSVPSNVEDQGEQEDQKQEQSSNVASPSKVSYEPSTFLDTGNAEKFCDLHYGDREDLKYTGSDSRGIWWVYDGVKWRQDDVTAKEKAITFAKAMYWQATHEKAAIEKARDQLKAEEKAADQGKKDEMKEQLDAAEKLLKNANSFCQWAAETNSSGKIRAFMNLSKPFFTFERERFDAAWWEINTPSGIVNLQTGELTPHSKSGLDSHYHTKCTAVSLDSCTPEMVERWNEFIDAFTCCDSEYAKYLQLTFGRALYGRVFQEEAVFLWGPHGNNGKSTLATAIRHCCGDYATTMQIDVLMSGTMLNRDAFYDKLPGVRIVFCPESEEYQHLSSAALKHLTSVDDIVCNPKYRDAYTFTPSHSVFCHFNHRPTVSSRDGGTWRRIKICRCDADFSGENEIYNYGEKLVEECGPAVLQWIVDGAVEVYKSDYKIDTPQIVRQTTLEYEAAEDWLQNFLDERCIQGPDKTVTAQDLYDVYSQWANDNGHKRCASNNFKRSMEDAGFEQVKNHHTARTWLGLELTSDAAIELAQKKEKDSGYSSTAYYRHG